MKCFTIVYSNIARHAISAGGNIFCRLVDLKKIKIGENLFPGDEYYTKGIGKLHFYAVGEERA